MPWASGLPPAAAARVERQRTGGMRGSLLSAAAMASLRGIGLSPVGEVMGCVAMHLQLSSSRLGSAYLCGWSGSWSGGWGGGGASGAGSPPVVVSSAPGPTGVGLGPYARAVTHSWETALQRLVTEAAVLGADGVVGVVLSEQPIAGQLTEFVALGTAVRAEAVRPPAMFVTDLSGEDVAALAAAGWAPVAIALGVSVAVRHNDWRGLGVTSSYSGWNGEVAGPTELLAACRADARAQVHARARALGGEHLALTGMTTWTRHWEVAEGHQDIIAGTTLVGTTLRRVDPAHAVTSGGRSLAMMALPVMPLSVMPLSGTARAATRRTANPYRGDR